MMGVPLQCSAVLVREWVRLCFSLLRRRDKITAFCPQLITILFPLQGLLQGCNSMCADYLFQPDKQYDVTYDTGDKAIQCGRHVDIFKFWLMWKAKVCISSLSLV